MLVVNEEKLTAKNIEELREYLKNQMDHCDCQIARFKKMKDSQSQLEWYSKKLGLKHTLDEVDELFMKENE